MKKQILFLTFFVLALIAGTSTVFGQMRQSSKAPNPLTGCTGSPLNPIAGVSYDYVVTNPNGEAATYTWWATKNPNFIETTNGTFLADTANMLYVGQGLVNTSAGYGDFTNANTTMSITWSADILAATEYQGTPNINGTPAAPSPTFVAVEAKGDCNNNLQIFELNPTPSFTLDIANISPADTSDMAYGDQAEQCVDIVRSAIYSGAQLNMDYGTDTLLFEVIAANFVESWIPTFQIMSGLSGDQTATIGWAYTKADALAGNFVEAEQAIATTLTGSTALTATSGLNTALGVSIYVRIVVDNNTTETIADNLFALAVDGEDNSGQWDINQAEADCDEAGPDQTDIANHNITKRPDIQDSTDDSANPTPDNTFVVSPRN